jgi:hypothetical protein
VLRLNGASIIMRKTAIGLAAAALAVGVGGWTLNASVLQAQKERHQQGRYEPGCDQSTFRTPHLWMRHQ